MKPNKKITENVRNSIANFRKTIIRSTIELCRQIDKYDQGDMALLDGVTIVKASMKKGVITTNSFVATRMFFWYKTDYYFIKNDDDAAANSFDMSLDSLVAVYDAVKKIVSAH